MSLTFRTMRGQNSGVYTALRYGNHAPIGSYTIRRETVGNATQRWSLYRVHQSQEIRTHHVLGNVGGYATLTDAKRGAEFLETAISRDYDDAKVMNAAIVAPREAIGQVEANMHLLERLYEVKDPFQDNTLVLIGTALYSYFTRDGAIGIPERRLRDMGSWFIRTIVWPQAEVEKAAREQEARTDALEADLAEAHEYLVQARAPKAAPVASYHEVPVVLDVMAYNAEEAAAGAVEAMQAVNLGGHLNGRVQVESWWPLYAEHKAAANNDNDPGAILYQRHWDVVQAALEAYNLQHDVDPKLLVMFRTLVNQEI